jgi:hypothetical protein
MAEQKQKSDWMAGASVCIFLPMVVNLIVLATYMLGY